MVLSNISTRSVDKVVEDFVLVAEDVVVDVEHLGRLSSENERLHEATHWTHVIRQLSSHLDRTTASSFSDITNRISRMTSHYQDQL